MAERTLEVHAPRADAHLHTDDWLQDRLLSELRTAIDRAAKQNQATWLTGNGERIAAVVPEDHAERGKLSVGRQQDLAELAADLLAMVSQKVAPRGHEVTRERWEFAVRGILAQVFRLGYSVGWEQCAAAHAARSPEL